MKDEGVAYGRAPATMDEKYFRALSRQGMCKVGTLSLRAKREVSFAPYKRDFSAQKARFEMTSRIVKRLCTSPAFAFFRVLSYFQSPLLESSPRHDLGKQRADKINTDVERGLIGRGDRHMQTYRDYALFWIAIEILPEIPVKHDAAVTLKRQ